MYPIKEEGDNATSEPNIDDVVEPVAKRRGRRDISSKKAGRLAALEQLKKSKASGKRFYNFDECQNVYDIVDEDEYSEVVRKRQEDDWIVDDDGGGYVEDGREIFDDDLVGRDEPAEMEGKKKKGKSQNSMKKKVNKPSTAKNDLRSMFLMNATKAKKPEKDIKLEDDDLLGEMLNEMQQETGPVIKPKSIKRKVKTPRSQPSQTPTRGSGHSMTPRNMYSDLTPERSSSSKLKAVKREPETSPKSRPEKRFKQTVKMEPKDEPEPEPEIEESPESMEDFTPAEIEEYESQMETTETEEEEVKLKVTEVKEEKKFIAAVKEKPRPKINPAAVSDLGWETVRDAAADQKVMDLQIDSSSLPLTTNAEGEEVLRFYWLDAYEDQYRQPGVVYLFGKVFIESAKAYVSCCVTVKNIERTVYILPKEKNGDKEVTMMDVYEEFDELASQYKITKYRSKKVTKQYCFSVSGVPAESEYLEVRYGAEFPPLPENLKGKTFSHIFGIKTSSLELFLMERKIRGPSWIDVKTPQSPQQQYSWCKVEAIANKPDQLSVYPDGNPPPLVVMTISLKTVVNTKTHQNEVLAISAMVHHKFPVDKASPKPPFQQYLCAITTPTDCVFPFDFRDTIKKKDKNVEVMPNERALLGYFLARVQKFDPDVIVGHDIYGFDLDVLLHRISSNKVPHWSRLGRLKRSIMPKLAGGPQGRTGAFAEKNATCGRLICDIKISAMELIRSKSYDLTQLTNQILKKPRQNIPLEDIRNMYGSSKDLVHFVDHTLMDTNFILQIMCDLNVLPLANQLTNICGNVMSRTLMGGRSERNEYLLLHAFHEKNFICPDKEFKKKAPIVDIENEGEGDGERPSTSRKSRRKPAYAGGLVLEPKKGFYDQYILLLDFNSLYPSIIQEYNICFTTISNTPKENQEKNDDEDWIPGVPDSDLPAGILPTEIRRLVERRKQVKQLMKTPDLNQDLKLQYDIRQKALKLTANSMYGCLGFSHSRFHAKPLAALVTSKGREILMHTKEMVEKMNLDVIYGDTDSIMINTNCTDLDQVYKVGNKVKSEVNKLYKLLEIDIDGIYKSMLLLKKKKYAALAVEKGPNGEVNYNRELKGLDIVRRDWCDLAKDVGNYAIQQILSADSREAIVEKIHTRLMEVGEQVTKNEIPLEKFEIRKSLTKSPQDYPDKKSLPHVQVALRHNQQGGKMIGAGDTVSYIVCEDGSNLPASQRAYHPDEMRKQSNLTVDVKYYLAQQIHPVISRLCDPIEGTDTAQIAECLGLDPSGYRHAMNRQDDEDDALLGGAAILDDEERFKDAERFKFICPNQNCKKENIVDCVFYGSGADVECQLLRCGNKECSFVPIQHVTWLQNQITMIIRQHVRRYYMGWLVCEDSSCEHRTRTTPLNPQRRGLPCPACTRAFLSPEYSDKDLYNQLSFYQSIFDVEKAQLRMASDKKTAMTIIAPHKDAYAALKMTVDQTLRNNSYSEVNLCQLFQGLFPMTGVSSSKRESL
ncbi:DNA polymerase alpha catalytic subunit [Holothuria leucospilota]|uniref:DNA polymerase n=1 Tax=Holothuria leucospilota TaxID=206669 RepID=A0A9Q1BP74_HOLLE|nr:DNA polymerase alpha catalytic subunit [Holothuria leucospilota]